MKKLIFLLLVSTALVGCKTVKPKPVVREDVVEISGKLEKLGMSTFQYGTHVLHAGDTTYALKSEKISLDQYVDKQVKLKGTKEKGYPIEAGPDLINVEEVTVK